jgi:hypothetical protein
MSSPVFALRLAFVILIAGSLPAAAQPPAERFSWSIAPVYGFDGGLDAGGEAGYTSVLTRLGRSWSLDQQSSLGVQLKLDYEDWRFDDPVGFGGHDPWGQIYRTGLSFPFSHGTRGGWRLLFSPTIEYSGESGAELSDALEYGATLSALRRLGPDLTLGLGVGVFERIEETSVFPFIAIDWRINERLRLSNPFVAGPAGPAGLELSYTLGSDWRLGLGAAYRSLRHRLDRDGPFPGGVGEYRFIPVFVNLGRDLSPSVRFSLYAGVALDGELRVEDKNGRRLYEDDQDPTPMLGISVIGRF